MREREREISCSTPKYVCKIINASLLSTITKNGTWKTLHTGERTLIYRMSQNGKSYAEIAEMMMCSRKMVYNALNLVKKDSSYLSKKTERKPKPRKTDVNVDRAIIRKSKADPFKSARQIMLEINQESGLQVSRKLVGRRLNEAQLFGRISRKKPLLSKRHIKHRLAFAKAHKDKSIQFWKNVLWTDETKINRMGPDGKTIVRRPKNQALNPRFTKKTIKHGGGSIMVWGAFSWHGVGPIVRVVGKMDRFQYLDILQNKMEPFVFEFMPLNWTFMQDNDPKHTAKTVKQWLRREKINVLDWPAQSPDLNPIENLWNDVKVKIANKNFKNFDDLWAAVEEAWYSIPKERCHKLVESMERRLEEVIKNGGYSTKY